MSGFFLIVAGIFIVANTVSMILLAVTLDETHDYNIGFLMLPFTLVFRCAAIFVKCRRNDTTTKYISLGLFILLTVVSEVCSAVYNLRNGAYEWGVSILIVRIPVWLLISKVLLVFRGGLESCRIRIPQSS